jgi:hypothetical protein
MSPAQQALAEAAAAEAARVYGGTCPEWQPTDRPPTPDELRRANADYARLRRAGQPVPVHTYDLYNAYQRHLKARRRAELADIGRPSTAGGQPVESPVDYLSDSNACAENGRMILPDNGRAGQGIPTPTGPGTSTDQPEGGRDA